MRYSRKDHCAAHCYRDVHCCIVPLCQSGNAPNPFATRSGSARSSQSALLLCGSRLHARSDNEVFDYLVTVGTNQRDDLEQLVYALFGNLADSLARRFQSLETVSQLHLALTDTFIKYALTALPEVPPSLMAGARARATKIYEQVNITAAREFQRRRESDAYSAAELGIEEEPTTLS